MSEAQLEDGVEVEVEGYDDRYLRLWPVSEAPEWATEALGLKSVTWPVDITYVLFVPARELSARTPDDWWAALLRPALLDCVVKSVDEDGACVLGLAAAVSG